MKILVALYSPFAMWTIPDGHVDRLRREFPQHVFLHARNAGEAERLIAEADVAFASQIDPAQLAAARRLRWIHSAAAGIGGMLFPAMIASPVRLTNSRGLSADTMAEHVVAVTLALFRRLPLAWRRQAEHVWAQDEVGSGNRSLAGSAVLVVGLGSIGTAVASRMAALGALVSAVRRNVGAGAPACVRELAPPDRLRELLATSDVVVITAPQTRDTRGLIGRSELAAMRPDAVLVNVSRGKLVDEEALADALRTARIGGAALDVFDHEPLPPDSPLWDLPGLLITPHTSGFRPNRWDDATALFADNLRRFEAGEALRNPVDKEAGY